MLRLVLDTNVFISSLISRAGPPARLLDAWRDGRFEILVSDHLLAELEAVLGRRKFSGISASETTAILDELRARGAHVVDPPRLPAVLDDPADEFLVALAAAAEADAIVSGDAHLADVPASVCRVLTPRAAVELLEL